MQSLYSVDLPTLEQVLEFSPLNVLPDTLLIDAIAQMDLGSSNTSNFSSCILIVKEKKLLGILTSRDVVRLIGARVDLSKVKISEVMTQPVISLTFAPAENALTALSVMRQHRIRHLPVVDEQGELLGLITQDRIFQVIQPAQQELELRVAERTSELMPANALLQQREQQWQALFDHALDAIAITDDQGRYVEVNQAACELFGVSREELLGSTIADFAAPGFDFPQAWQQFREQGQRVGEFSLHRPDGTVRETEFAAVANFIPHHHLSILRDVSDRQAALRDRQQAQENLQKSEQRLNLALSAGRTGIWDWNLQTNELNWSESLFTVFGLTPETFNVSYENFLNLIVHPEDRQRVHQSLSRAVNQEAPHELEFRFIHPDGTVRWSFCKGKVFYDDTTNQPLQMIGVNTEITERKQAEAALREAQESLEIAIEAAQMGTWYLDLSTDFSPRRSLRHDQIFGYDTPQIEWGWKIFKGHVIEEDCEICNTAFTHAIETGKLDFEVRIQWSDGSIHWMVARGRFYFDENGNPLYAVGVNFDITDLKQAEAALRESEQRLKLALSASNTGTWDWNIQTNELIWSESMCSLFNIDPQAFEGKLATFFNFVHPEDREFVEQSIKQSIDEQSICDIEFRIVWRDGTVHWANGKGKVFCDGTGKPLRMIGVHHDITERKQAEEALRESEQRLQSIIDNSPAVIYFKDMQGRHILVNCAFERIIHQTREEVKNKTNHDIFAPHIAEVLTRNDQDILTSLMPMQFEEEVQLDDGLHTFLTVKFPLCDSLGQPYGIGGISTDITERKQTEQIFHNIAAGVSATTGQTFFHSLVQYLASALQVDYAFVGILVNVSAPYMRTIAVFGNGSLMENIEYDLANTPCLKVITQKTCVYANNVQQEFPQDLTLAELNIESYAGSPLFDLTGSVVGVIAVMHRQKLTQPQLAVSVLQTFAARAAAELERQQTEVNLQQSERKLRSIFDSTFQFMGLLTTEGIVIDINRTALDIVAANLSDVIGKPFWETPWWVHFPEQQPRLQEAVVRAANGELVRMETKHIWADGSLAFVDCSMKPIFDETGTVVMLVPEGRDITERKQAEIEIRKFVSLVDNSSEFIGMCNMDLVPFYINEAGRQMVGLNDSQYSATLVREFFFPEDQDFITNEFLSRVLREGRAEVEIRFRHFQTGEALWMVFSVSCIKDINDQLIGLATVSRNITERKLAEQKIQEQAALIDIATDAIFVRDLEKHILFWSRGSERLYGWTAEESLGRKADEFVCKGSFSQLATGLQETLEKGSWQGEVEQITKAGRKIIVSSRWSLIENQFGRPQTILVVNTDITEKKQLEQQFYRAQRLESIGTLASGIAHDLNNVFAPIMMIAQLLPSRCQNVSEQTKELFKTLETTSKRGSDLVRQILTFARGTEGKRIVLQVGHLLNELVNVLKQTFPKSIEIVKNIPSDTLWIVQADPTQLEQVLMNLAVNARDAMPNGGKLTITAENRTIDETYARMHLEAKAGGYVVVSVLDTGTGIPPEFLERIFDPFFTTKEVGKGTGLGLSTVLGIVKNHGGFVEVSSKVGKGTKFEVFLPRGEGAAIETITKAELPRGNGELILVVDDEAIVQQTTQETLADYNYKTMTANDGIEAIALYAERQQEISAILLDMVMPNMDGLTAIRILRTINPNVKIIATSGLPTNEPKALAVGAAKFLSKPYTARDLLHTLSDAIRIIRNS